MRTDQPAPRHYPAKPARHQNRNYLLRKDVSTYREEQLTMPLPQLTPGSVRLFYSSYNVAAVLGISPPTARKLMKNGLIANCFQAPESEEWRAPAPSVLDYAIFKNIPVSAELRRSVEQYKLQYPD